MEEPGFSKGIFQSDLDKQLNWLEQGIFQSDLDK